MTGSGAASSWSASSAIAAAVCFLVLRRRCLLSSAGARWEAGRASRAAAATFPVLLLFLRPRACGPLELGGLWRDGYG